MHQNILDAKPDAKLRVYYVWLPMLPGDDRSAWNRTAFADRRARHYWDGERVLGEWLADRGHVALDYPGPIVWDAYLLFGPKARWDDRPSHLLDFGWTVIGSTDGLSSALQPLIGRVG